VPIAKNLAEPLPAVWADGAQIRQVIHNLVQNAQDALESLAARGASPTIEVRTELAGDRVRLAVSDNGAGFPEELMARIFEPYVTDQAARHRPGPRDGEEDRRRAPWRGHDREPPSSGASVSVLLPLAKAA
jgi:signal transduction histidine kinase